MSKKIEFTDRQKDDIFEMLLEGEGIYNTAAAFDCSAHALLSHMRHGDLQGYVEFLDANIERAGAYYYDPRKERNYTPRKYQLKAEPIIEINHEYDRFKQSIYIGKKVKNYVTHESGVVCEIYPNVFTIITEWGYKTSFGYYAAWEFDREKVIQRVRL